MNCLFLSESYQERESGLSMQAKSLKAGLSPLTFIPALCIHVQVQVRVQVQVTQGWLVTSDFYSSSLYPSILKCDGCDETFNHKENLKRHVDPNIIFFKSFAAYFPKMWNIPKEIATIYIPGMLNKIELFF